MWHAFVFLLTLLVRLLRAACTSRDELVLENLALRQQVTTLTLGRPRRKLHDVDRAFWVALYKSWSTWASRLIKDTCGERLLDATATVASSNTATIASR
jgi:hypothetical protein